MNVYLPFLVVAPLLAAVVFTEADPAATHMDERPPNALERKVVEPFNSTYQFKELIIAPAPMPTERAIYVEPTSTPSPTPTPTVTVPVYVQPKLSPAVGSLTETEMRALLTQVGFPEWSHDTALAVTHCESHWNPSVHNTTAPDNSIGLAQINTYGTLGPDRLAKLQALGYAVSTVDEARQLLFDPVANLRVAYVMSGGGAGWGAWSCAR